MTTKPTYWDHDGPREMPDVRDYREPPAVEPEPLDPKVVRKIRADAARMRALFFCGEE